MSNAGYEYPPNKIGNKNNRVRSFDTAKGIGIILVVIGHTSLLKNYNSLIYSFHMPLFFLISGYFLNSQVNLKTFLSKKASQLLLPYLYTALAGTLLMGILALVLECDISIPTIFQERLIANAYGLGWLYTIPIIDRHIQMAGTIWFLPGLFFALLTVRFALRLNYPMIFIVLISCIAYFSSKILMLPMSFQAGLNCSLFVYLGYCAKQTDFVHSKEFKSLILLIVALIFWGISVLKIGTIGVSMCYYSNMFPNIIAATCMSYVILRISMAISRIRILERILSYCGASSLFIFCIHAGTQAALWQFSPEFKNDIDIPVSPIHLRNFIIISPFLLLLLRDAILYTWKAWRR